MIKAPPFVRKGTSVPTGTGMSLWRTATLLPGNLAVNDSVRPGRLASNRSSKEGGGFAEVRFAHLAVDRYQNHKGVNT